MQWKKIDMIRTHDLEICSLNHCATLLVNVFWKKKYTCFLLFFFLMNSMSQIEMSHTTFKKK